ncbi:hypothetical protein [Paenibacillus eucommiae]|uniref:Uncharacterized protein n=1 Tax=Paenibacillus eucommiae TaxID=1355755 RepID=A0ABS4JAQ1_9BACL|nr:hypothetical protein [Paenibacillus eucommiae]MBP1996921.1 hypothetical protein [Paenibacillus eucommiae]
MPFSGAGWDPRRETWRDFEEKMDQYYKMYKEAYRARSERFLRERGYVKEKEKRNYEHFKWLVHYQVQGWNLREIADHYNTSKSEVILQEDAIFRGIKSTAELVRLPLRIGKQK